MPPLTPAVVHALLALAGGDRHGVRMSEGLEHEDAVVVLFMAEIFEDELPTDVNPVRLKAD